MLLVLIVMCFYGFRSFKRDVDSAFQEIWDKAYIKGYMDATDYCLSTVTNKLNELFEPK